MNEDAATRAVLRPHAAHERRRGGASLRPARAGPRGLVPRSSSITIARITLVVCLRDSSGRRSVARLLRGRRTHSCGDWQVSRPWIRIFARLSPPLFCHHLFPATRFRPHSHLSSPNGLEPTGYSLLSQVRSAMQAIESPSTDIRRTCASRVLSQRIYRWTILAIRSASRENSRQ